MKTNVDNVAFALAGNAVAVHALTYPAPQYVNDGSFLSYTGYTDKVILAVGTVTQNQSIKIVKVTDGTVTTSFGPINTGGNDTTENYMGKYITTFQEIPQTSLILVSFYHTSFNKPTISTINYAAETTTSIVADTTYKPGQQLALYPGTSIVLFPIIGAAENIKSSKTNMVFCAISCKTCAIVGGASKCTECLNALFGLQADNISCAACPLNSKLENMGCVCDPGYTKEGGLCVSSLSGVNGSCFSQSLIAKSGKADFGQIAAYDGRNSKQLVLVFNRELDFNSSTLDDKIKLSSVKLDGSDPVAISGLRLVKTTSLHLLHLTYDTPVPEDRSIRVESLAGFKLVTVDTSGTTPLTDIGTQICPKTDSDAQVYNAKRVEDYVYTIQIKKSSLTDNTFKTTGEITSINYAVLGMDKIGLRKNLIYNVYSEISKEKVILKVDLKWIPKEGVTGDQEVVLFYHAGLGTSGGNSEDKKYLSENFMPAMFKVRLSSSAFGILTTTLIFVTLIEIFIN